jgi:hypothetical protein
MIFSAAAGPTNPQTRFVTGGSVFRAKLPAITGGPDFDRGLFFVVLAPFPAPWPLLNFAVALEIDLNQSIL